MTPLLNSLRLDAGNEAAIGAGSLSKAQAMSVSRTDQIRSLNDTFRNTLIFGGQCVLTHGVCGMGEEFTARSLTAVKSFSEFTEDNDPYGEHDFGAFSIGDTQCIWKIDYYDLSMHFGSNDPADTSQTKRVLTIMLAEEY